MMSEELSHEPAFHEGEVALQREAGVAELMGRVGPHVIRDAMPDPHRAFFGLLPFIVVGSIGDGRQPAASLLAGRPGFVGSPDAATLRIDALPHPEGALARNLVAGAPLGVLGIQPHTRRRNRANGVVARIDERGFSLAVRQSFGNCPKYIYPREPVYAGGRARASARVSASLDPSARALLESADTFFLASAHPAANEHAARAHGVDVSHRGGPVGFVHFVDERTLIIPDFQGNNFFNTLGNVRLNPLVGLLFVDLARGDLLELEAHARLLPGEHPLADRAATGRIVRFTVQRVRVLPGESSLRWREGGA